MKIKIKLGDADADRTEVHQIKLTTSDIRRVLNKSGFIFMMPLVYFVNYHFIKHDCPHNKNII
ncbi:hypothetical protein ABFD43_00820, partial [Streptococcus suis]|uniref:hypothetical protein n=1 Tax=Streptococcus suis TaxID=1307 RepID=UPI003F017B65